MATECSNHFYYQLLAGLCDMDTDVLKCRLMATGFTFNRDNGVWADISASELSAGNGYLAGGITWPGTISITEDDTNDRADVTSTADPTWNASGGSIGPSPGMSLIDDTTTDDTIVGYVDFGGDQTATDGGTFEVTDVTVRIAKPA